MEVPPCGAAGGRPPAVAELQYVVGDYSGRPGRPAQGWPPVDVPVGGLLPTTAAVCHDPAGLVVRWATTDPGARHSTQTGCRDPVWEQVAPPPPPPPSCVMKRCT